MRHAGGRLARTRRIRRSDARLHQPTRRVTLAVSGGGRPRRAAGAERLSDLPSETGANPTSLHSEDPQSTSAATRIGELVPERTLEWRCVEYSTNGE